MTDATERIINLALYLAAGSRPASAEEVRANITGYPAGQDDAAFARMFERDKEVLREAGLVLSVDRTEGTESYRLDASATYAGRITLDPRETMELRAAGLAMLADPSFPYGEDLRFALAKLMAGADVPDVPSAPALTALTADEDPKAQGAAVALLTDAATLRKRVRFAYTGAHGKHSAREVEPWGLFAREGRWYLVGRDPAAGATRVFAVSRMRDTTMHETRPKTPDFQPPADFDVRRWMVMPFQFGPTRTDAVLSFSGATARRAEVLTAGQGALSAGPEGVVIWRVPVADEALLARWVAETGPGVEILEPASARETLLAGLRRAVARHG